MYTDPIIKTVEGIFDGTRMWGDDNLLYPVSPNYASKSKMVEGDRLKLTIDPNGGFMFKQIAPVHRRKILGKFIGEETVEAEGKKYKVLMASLTYFKVQPGDECVIVIPELGNPTWAALDDVIKVKFPELDPDKEL